MYEQTLAAKMNQEWSSSPRWAGVTRPYGPEQVLRLRGSLMRLVSTVP